MALTAQQWLARIRTLPVNGGVRIGIIPRSGFALKREFAAHDARSQLPRYGDPQRKRLGQMPAGCDCAAVVLGKIYPTGCRLYGTACTPCSPIGPCMVSDEGACRIWWSSGMGQPEAPQRSAS